MTESDVGPNKPSEEEDSSCEYCCLAMTSVVCFALMLTGVIYNFKVGGYISIPSLVLSFGLANFLLVGCTVCVFRNMQCFVPVSVFTMMEIIVLGLAIGMLVSQREEISSKYECTGANRRLCKEIYHLFTVVIVLYSVAIAFHIILFVLACCLPTTTKDEEKGTEKEKKATGSSIHATVEHTIGVPETELYNMEQCYVEEIVVVEQQPEACLGNECYSSCFE